MRRTRRRSRARSRKSKLGARPAAVSSPARKRGWTTGLRIRVLTRPAMHSEDQEAHGSKP